jgi:hypothetical protein
MHRQITVREAIELLKKVEDQDLPLAVWINSQTPEPVYTGCDRIPVVHVDTSVTGVIDICCEAPMSPTKGE